MLAAILTHRGGWIAILFPPTVTPILIQNNRTATFDPKDLQANLSFVKAHKSTKSLSINPQRRLKQTHYLFYTSSLPPRINYNNITGLHINIIFLI